MKQPKVVHCKKHQYDIYIGRPSKWGNPFRVGNWRGGSRNEVIERYKWWLLNNPPLLNDIYSLEGKTLGCWCKPLACHGDVLVDLLTPIQTEDFMSPTINLGVDYSELEHLDEFVVVPGGTYQFTVRGIDEKTTKAGRPMLVWRLEVADPESQRPVTIFYNTVLPWMDNGEMNVKGCGMLVSASKAVGMPWTGQSLNTEDYIGRSGTVELKVEKTSRLDPATNTYVADPDGKDRNEVVKFHY